MSGHKRHGYVLKKLVKRSSLFAYVLGVEKENLLLASEKIIANNSDFYPFLLLRKDYILRYLDGELTKFLQSFEVSNKSIKRYLKTFSERKVPAEKVFFWYDTEGIPIELVKLSLSNEGKTFDQGMFDDLLNKQKERSFSRQVRVNVFDS